jgi:hypothetical protein
MRYRKESLESLLLYIKKPRISDNNLGNANRAKGSPATWKTTRLKVLKLKNPYKLINIPY